jgi:xanthine dehydrogenase iron-sulfur cluster and FAD-binding subunit A
MAKKPVRFTHNGRETAVFAESGSNLLDVLRRVVGDLSPKYGCGQGTCGTCTVLIDGEPHLSCLTLAETVEGRKVDTTGGLQNGPDLHPLQKAFMEGFRGPMRLLHARHADGRQGAARPQSKTDARRGRRGDFGQHLPLHRL